MVAHIVSTPGLLKTVREIIAPCYDKETDSFDWKPLYDNDLLQSLISETLRLHSNITVLRLVTEDTEVELGENREKKLVKKGDIMLTVTDLVHWDEKIYPDPLTWKAERFLPENHGKLVIGDKDWKTYIPWGGGMHMCTGRFFAKNEMIIQLTMLVWYHDIELHNELPKHYIKERFGMGVAHPDGPLRATVTKRA